MSYNLLEAYMKVSPLQLQDLLCLVIGFIIQIKVKKQQRLGYYAFVEMETHILYALANKFNKQPLSVAARDHLDGKQKTLTAEQRENALIE